MDGDDGAATAAKAVEVDDFSMEVKLMLMGFESKAMVSINLGPADDDLKFMADSGNRS